MAVFDRILNIVRKIPKGRVATYGQIAALAGVPRAARTVGWALHGLGDEIESVPWYRVINREGRISTTCLDHTAEQQGHILSREGVSVEQRDGNFWVELKKFQWRPR
jgi:methylated-DNA-protein-cysteine methyltransferase-like protein